MILFTGDFSVPACTTGHMTGGSLSGGSLTGGVSVQGGLCLGRGGVSVRETLPLYGNAWAVRILLECILVQSENTSTTNLADSTA